jgi:hypothetical protein
VKGSYRRHRSWDRCRRDSPIAPVGKSQWDRRTNTVMPERRTWRAA